MNAKNELVEFLIGKADIECAEINFARRLSKNNENVSSLQKNHTFAELKSFLEALDFEYHDGYGSQELDGTVWLTDGTWLERGEYDGAEWWEHRVRPAIPKELLK